MKQNLKKELCDLVKDSEIKELKEKLLQWLDENNNMEKLLLLWMDDKGNMHIQGHNIIIVEGIGMLIAGVDELKEVAYEMSEENKE